MLRSTPSRLLTAVLALSALSIVPRVAQAGLIIDIESVAPAVEAASGGDSLAFASADDGARFSYTAEVGQHPVTPSGKSFFTIYDFAGFQSGTNLQPEGWEFSYDLVGKTPRLVQPFDDPELYNLTWTYVGPGALRLTTLTGFSAISSILGTRDGLFSSADTRTHAAGTVVVPDFVNPEPSSLALLGIGATCVAGAFTRRRRAIA